MKDSLLAFALGYGFLLCVFLGMIAFIFYCDKIIPKPIWQKLGEIIHRRP